MNRIAAFTDVEFDEHAAVRRRCKRGFKPVQRLPISVEEAAYNAYKRDPQGTTDRLYLADNSNRRELAVVDARGNRRNRGWRGARRAGDDGDEACEVNNEIGPRSSIGRAPLATTLTGILDIPAIGE
jgi:hypothetical protein